MTQSKTHILLTIFLSFAFNLLNAQNQLKDSGRIVLHNTKMWVEKKDTIPPIIISNTLSGKSYPIGGGIQTSMTLIKQGFTTEFPKPFLDEVIPPDMYFSKKYEEDKKFRIKESLQIDNCYYKTTSGLNDMISEGVNEYIFEKDVTLNKFSSDCILFFEKMIFQNGLNLSNSEIHKLWLSKCNGNISFGNVTFKSNVFIDSSNIQIKLRQIKQAKNDTLEFSITNSKISFFEINPRYIFDSSSLPRISKFEFINDSISGTFLINENLPKLIDNTSIFKFTNCYINSKFNVINFNGGLFVFDNCVFGPLVDMPNLSVSKIEFKDCINIQYKIKLKSFSNTNGFITNLRVINSDLTNINFDYSPNFKLNFSGHESMELHENTNSVFEILINRFKSEGKLTSYESLKVEYMQYLYSKQSVFGYIKNLFQNYWWYYGFRKSYIIYWTIFFLTLFTLFNYFNLSSMKETYFSGLGSKKNYYDTSKRLSFTLKKIISVFVYTSFIFFSLKVDFDNIKDKNTGFLLAFFLQYFIGLICLFFIINAILQFE